MRKSDALAAPFLAIVMAIPAWVCASPDNDVRVIPGGAEVLVRTNETIDSKDARDGQSFSGVIDKDVIDDRGEVAVPKGSDATLTIAKTSVDSATLGLSSITIEGKVYRVASSDVEQDGRDGVGKNKRTAKMVGGGAVLGTVIGAIAGHGKGAAIGAVSGATAGGVTQQMTKGKERIPAETVLHFRLDQSLHFQTKS